MSVQGSKSVPTSQQVREGISEVFFTEKTVKSSEAVAAVPKGYRMARPDEVALNWKESPAFLKALYDLPCAVWSDQTGLTSSGPHKIDENGKSVKITDAEFMALDAKDRSWHYSGTGLVALLGYHYWGGGGSLDVNAGARSDLAARVAYVALEEGAQKSGNSNTELASLVRETLPPIIAVLEPSTKPEILENLRSLLRAASETKE